MTWCLKDKDLERKLNEIDPNFSKNLTEVCKHLESDKDESCLQLENFTLPLVYNSRFLCDVFLNRKYIEKVQDYNPHDWNKYPEITPPEGVWMRFDTPLGEGFKAIFKYGKWFDCYDQKIDRRKGRFRPWETK